MKLFRIPEKWQVYARWAFVTVLFLLISWTQMGSTFTHMSQEVMSKPGDHTSGIMYNTWVSPTNPVPRGTQYTNYPYGEDLWQPLAYSSLVPSTLHVVFSYLTDIVTGWNLLVLFGFMSSALAMYGLMYWLTRNMWVAIFAAYVVTVTPYHAFSTWGQIAGLLGAVFTLAFWQFLVLWRRPTIRNAMLLGALFGVGLYTDGYYILIGLVMLLAFWAATLAYGFFIAKLGFAKVRRQLIALLIASGTMFIMLLPLAWASQHYASQISSIFANARGAIQLDAQEYSAQPYMYIQPKSLLFLGFSVLALSAVTIGLLYIDRRRVSKPQKLNDDPLYFAGWTAAVVAVLGAWFSLRPTGTIAGITVHNPSSIIIAVTSSWRVFGRLHAIVSIATAVLAGLGLLWLIRKLPRWRYAILGASFLALIVEFWAFAPPRPSTFDYAQTPQVYTWLKGQKDIRGIAEYPLDEPPQGAYLPDYYTFQEVSEKPMLNTLRPNSPQMPLRRSVVGINDPQTLPVLRALGIGMVNVRLASGSTGKIDVRKLAAANPELQRKFSDERYLVDSYLIKPGKVADYALVIPTVQYFQVDLTKDGSAKYMLDDNINLNLVKMPNAATRSTVTVSFKAQADSDRRATIVQNGSVLWTGVLHKDMQTIRFTATTDQPIVINNEKSSELTHINLSELLAE